GGLYRDLGTGLVRSRQDRARRCLARWRQELARSEDRWASSRQGLRALLRRHRMDWTGIAAAVARDRRNRIRAADQKRAAQDSRQQLDLSQQPHPDLAR